MADKTLPQLISDLTAFTASLEASYANAPVVNDPDGNRILPANFAGAFNTVNQALGNVNQSLSAGGALKLVAKPETPSAPGAIGEFHVELSPVPFIYFYTGSGWVRFQVSTW